MPSTGKKPILVIRQCTFPITRWLLCSRSLPRSQVGPPELQESFKSYEMALFCECYFQPLARVRAILKKSVFFKTIRATDFFLKVKVLDRVARQEPGFHLTSGKICSKITRVGNRGGFFLKGPAQLDTQTFQRAAPSLVQLQLYWCQGKDANLQPLRTRHPQARCWSVSSAF